MNNLNPLFEFAQTVARKMVLKKPITTVLKTGSTKLRPIRSTRTVRTTYSIPDHLPAKLTPPKVTPQNTVTPQTSRPQPRSVTPEDILRPQPRSVTPNTNPALKPNNTKPTLDQKINARAKNKPVVPSAKKTKHSPATTTATQPKVTQAPTQVAPTTTATQPKVTHAPRTTALDRRITERGRIREQLPNIVVPQTSLSSGVTNGPSMLDKVSAAWDSTKNGISSDFKKTGQLWGKDATGWRKNVKDYSKKGLKYGAIATGTGVAGTGYYLASDK